MAVSIDPLARWRGRRRKGVGERRTYALGVVAVGTTAAVVGGEIARVWREGAAPLPAETNNVIGAAEVATRQTVEVAVEGYRESPRGEAALFNLLVAFATTFLLVRATTHVIRARGRIGPIGNVRVGRHHIHHFIPGIALAFASGGASVISRNEELDRWLALPFGAGVALTLDESALLLELEDVYWTEEGLVSVQVTLAALALLASCALALRLLRRGEARVLSEDGDETGALAERPPVAARPPSA